MHRVAQNKRRSRWLSDTTFLAPLATSLLLLPTLGGCAATTELTASTSPVGSSTPDTSAPPMDYVLDQVTISLRRDVTPPEDYAVNGHRVVSVRRTIDGRDGAVQEMRRTVEGDSALVTVSVLDDPTLVRLLNTFYTAGVFGYCHDPNRFRGVELVVGTRRLIGTERGPSDWTGGELCIQIADYRRCMSLIPSDPGEIHVLWRDLWRLGTLSN